MNFFATFLLSILLIFNQYLQIEAYPILSKKSLLLTPTSPVFTLLAVHKGNLTQADIVTFNKSSITIGNRGSPLFGRIDGKNNYTLNIASFNNLTTSTNTRNSTIWSINAYIDRSSNLLSAAAAAAGAAAIAETTHKNNESIIVESNGFAIEDGYLSFENSTNFLACPITTSITNSTTTNGNGNGNNSTSSNGNNNNNNNSNGAIAFEIYANPKGKTVCPKNIQGYDIKLLTELIVTYSYSEKFNSNGFFKRQITKNLE
ncbi:conserved hypothetical protein [Candida dubliniensis CD36]|uniref:Uncharacterized protein n=1 Tax=Candida dubliniensis (strain CD36 / ATCC MYA-646 / CBS 7987 / NCPF 3949 / NRRL Y-17841) TaxID=573826 RepID=B9W931_CANDC|nr:conserved hypothetical protein [Candida dubliniensis CD36]CAX45255.1 conserved hypothetical protein [Candida dubliniensis CD36]